MFESRRGHRFHFFVFLLDKRNVSAEGSEFIFFLPHTTVCSGTCTCVITVCKDVSVLERAYPLRFNINSLVSDCQHNGDKFETQHLAEGKHRVAVQRNTNDHGWTCWVRESVRINIHATSNRPFGTQKSHNGNIRHR